MILLLLDCLNYVDAFQDKDELRRFILDPTYVPGILSMLADADGENYLEELKKLSQSVEKVMNRIEDELVQLHTGMLVDAKRRDFHCSMKILVRLKENFNMYFGEDTDQPPDSLPEAEQCQYRHRRIFRLAGNNYGSLFDLRWTPDGEETLRRVRDLAFQNVQSQSVQAHDYMTLISVHLALMSINTSYLDEIKFDDMVTWSKNLYETREALHALYLEPYFFLTMFNWPRKNMCHCLPPKHIEMALRQWKEAYDTKYPHQSDEGKPYRKKDKTLFFLGSGSDMASIYIPHEECGTRRAYESRGDSSFWRDEKTMRNVERFQGLLLSGGKSVDVQLQYGQGHKCIINIATSLPIWNRTMWNRQVFFVIGFSWIGPKAFDITLDYPTLEADKSNYDPASNSSCTAGITRLRRKPIEEFTQEQFQKRFVELEQNLLKIQELREIMKHRPLSKAERSLISDEGKFIRKRQELLQQRKEFMESRIPEFS
jgi:hypothetical protein